MDCQTYILSAAVRCFDRVKRQGHVHVHGGGGGAGAGAGQAAQPPTTQEATGSTQQADT